MKAIDTPLSWETICEHEPRLLAIVRRIEAIKDRNEERYGTRTLRSDYSYDLWYGFQGSKGIRTQLREAVGWHSDSAYAAVRSAAAYDLCYRHLFALLFR